MKLAIKPKRLLALQALVMLYSFTSVLSKETSIGITEHGIFSWYTILPLVGLVAVLGVYAIFWQKVLVGVPLSVAYANKGLNVLWTLLWTVILFREDITVNNLIGTVIIVIGILLVVWKDE